MGVDVDAGDHGRVETRGELGDKIPCLSLED